MSGLVRAIFGGGGSAPPPPDYTPVAQASGEAARLGTELGREQLAENRRQYDQNMVVGQPIIDAQGKQMQLAYDQGKQTFDAYQDEGRPLQQALRDDAMGIVNPTQQRLQDEAAQKAMADARVGTTQQMGQLARTGMRYGWSPDRMAEAGATMANQGAQGQVAAANAGRTQAGNMYRAKLGDTFNTYTGMASNAPAFYSAGTNAGSAAVGNATGMSGQYMKGMNSGNNTMMQGQQMRIGGLGSILSSQTSGYTAGMAQQTARRGQDMDFLGTVAGSMMKSDARLKRNIVKLADDLRGFGWYAYEYVWGGRRRMGVLAQELELVMPAAVVTVGGYRAVDYAMLKGAVL